VTIGKVLTALILPVASGKDIFCGKSRFCLPQRFQLSPIVLAGKARHGTPVALIAKRKRRIFNFGS